MRKIATKASLKKRLLLKFLYGTVFICSFLFIVITFKKYLASSSFVFGYADYHHHFRVLNDFINLKMPFIDYYHRASYGFFHLLIQAPIFILFQKNFFALLVTRYFYLPILGVVTSIFIAKNILKKPGLIILFLTLCLLFTTNCIYESLRHLMAELSLSLVILFMIIKKPKQFIWAGIVAGISILVSLEYGGALVVTMLLITPIFVLYSRKYLVALIRFWIGLVIITFPYYFWLFIKGVLPRYLDYTLSGIDDFYFASPACTSSFPRFEDIRLFSEKTILNVFGFPIEFLKSLNMYFVFLFLLFNVIFIVLMLIRQKKKDQTKKIIKLLITVYGLMIFVRTLDTPALDYFSYGLVPFFLLLTIEIEELFWWLWQKKEKLYRVVTVLIFCLFLSWFFLTEQVGLLGSLFTQNRKIAKEESKTVYFPEAGVKLRSELVEDYREIMNYILKNTENDDYVYVYPWGPYNFLTNRRSPTSFPLPGSVGRNWEEITHHLASRKPKLVVINIYNNGGIAHYGLSRHDVPRYYSVPGENGPVFSGEGNPIQKYILENYVAFFENDIAIIMGQRTRPLEIETKIEETLVWEPLSGNSPVIEKMMQTRPGTYSINGKNAIWKILIKNSLKATNVSVELKIDGDFLTKHLSRYFIEMSVISNNGEMESIASSMKISSKKWEIMRVHLPELSRVSEVSVKIGKNTGLVWWLNPYRLEVKKVSFSVPNN